jgi:hypothetical protein
VTSSRYRLLFWAGLALVLVWAGVWAGFRIAESRRVTPEKVTAYATALDLSGLSGGARAEALERLAGMLNALGYEDRRALRMNRTLERLFEQMTDAEKVWFVENTLPTGLQQMLTAFEALPEDKRQRAVNDSLRRLREARSEIQRGQGQEPSDKVFVSEEMQRRMVEVGLKTFYAESSAQTKAELAPVLEEMQRLMESGRLLRDRRR